ncbi:MAG: ABC transporter ATP-binding protein [Deltaproteobacteria bacterium]|jgi:branched-chain amino acid transport system ATP-binding protein|nr:ABC transporter ATP-binding protein [Deltaproteobacteria bacterium]
MPDSACLELRSIRVAHGKVEALHGISLRADKGEIIALLGANGAGKTSTLSAISGLLRPSSGEILFEGRALHSLPSHEIVRLGITQAPEGRRIFGLLSVRENLDLGAFTRRDKAGTARTLDWILELFPRLRERLDQLAGTLSGGEQQMLAIGRALMGAPKLLLLDEPSLGLAPITARAIFQSVREVNASGVTVILVEQNARAALKLACRGYVLEAGRIALADTAQALLQNPEVRAAYLGGGD